MATFETNMESRSPTALDESVRDEISLRLKEKNLEHRTKIVEEALSPLIDEVTSLSEYSLADGQKSPRKKKREPQQLSKLIQLVDKATRNFLAVGEEIAHENPDFQEELLMACDGVRERGESLQEAATQFSQSPCEPDNRSKMTKASKELLLSVTRLMVVADMVDVNKLLEASSRIELKLKSLQTATSEKELVERIKDCNADMSYIIQRASIRPNDGKSESSLQLLATAQVDLNQAKRMLTCTSKAFIQFPGARAARENQEYVVIRMLDSLKTLALLASGDESSLFESMQPAKSGELALCFKRFEENLSQTVSLVADSSTSSSSQAVKTHTTKLQHEMDKIFATAAELAASRSTRDYRQHALITLCGQLKSQMNQLVKVMQESDKGAHSHEKSIGDLVTDTRVKMTELKRELCRTAVDQVSDVFMGTLGPLVSMCEAAQEGDKQRVKNRAEFFKHHAITLQKVALLSCSLSEDAESNRLAWNATKNVRTLVPQVINAAHTLTKKPNSLVMLKNMSVFKEAWAENISALTDAVDATTPLVEFMSVTETHICEDGQQFLAAAETCDTRLLEDTVQLIRGRCKRLCHVVKRELKNNRSSYSREQIHQSNGAMEKLVMKSMSQFCDLASKADETLHVTRDINRVNFKALEEALQKVVDNVRNVRRSILFTRAPEDLEGIESDLEDLLRPPRPMTPTPSLLSQISTGSASTAVGGQTTQKFQRTLQHSKVFEVEDSTKVMMTQLPPEQQAQIIKVTEDLTAQQAVFEAEVNKWDESGNDIVVLAKEMCVMMMDMSDFTRGVGPLHSTMDVIVTAKDIVRAANILDGLARSIADHCPDEQCQKDILSYLDRIRLYCHQLNITANVKADLKPSSSDTVENASMLITTSKNLMTAVVETVKTCYIASTAIARIHGGASSDQFVQWRLTLPRKKKLYRSDSDAEAGGNVESSTPIYELGQFKPGRSLLSQLTTIAEMPHKK